MNETPTTTCPNCGGAVTRTAFTTTSAYVTCAQGHVFSRSAK